MFPGDVSRITIIFRAWRYNIEATERKSKNIEYIYKTNGRQPTSSVIFGFPGSMPFARTEKIIAVVCIIIIFIFIIILSSLVVVVLV